MRNVVAGPAEASLSILVVDDEPPARRRLLRLLGNQPTAHVLAEASSVPEARAQLKASAIDLLLLDVELADQNAFELLAALPREAAVVLVSAHAEYAARAFEFAVLDYLLKPVRPERLSEALRRAQSWQRARDTPGQAPAFGRPTLVLTGRSGVRVTPLRDVVQITARDDHSELYLSDGCSYFDDTHMDDWEQRLPWPFVRSHRSHIANIALALGLTRRDNGWALRVGAHLLPVSRSRLSAVRAALGPQGLSPPERTE